MKKSFKEKLKKEFDNYATFSKEDREYNIWTVIFTNILFLFIFILCVLFVIFTGKPLSELI